MKPTVTTKSHFTLLMLLLSVFILSSCKKEGCTDPSAKNFCDECQREDHSCKYEGEAVFWYNQTAANGLLNDGATSLTYYVGGQLVGSSAAGVYWTGGGPDCGQNGSVTVTKNLGGVKTQSYDFKVKDQTGYVYWEGVVNFNANTCYALELAW